MAKSIKQACANLNDELYTPKILVYAIVPELKLLHQKLKKILKREPIIWLPFDTEQSEFAYMCRKLNLNIFVLIYEMVKIEIFLNTNQKYEILH